VGFWGETNPIILYGILPNSLKFTEPRHCLLSDYVLNSALSLRGVIE